MSSAELTPADLLAALGLPPQALVHLRVSKQELGQRVTTPADRRLIQEAVEQCTWAASLTPTSCGVAAMRDAERDYGEVAVVMLHLRQPAARDRLRTVLHRAIPYPLVLICGGMDAGIPDLSLVHRRRGPAGSVVLDGDLVTGDDQPWTTEQLASLALAELSPTDLFALYDGWLGRLETRRAAAITGAWIPARTPVDVACRRTALARHRELEALAAGHARRLRTTTQLAAVVAANGDLHAVRQQQRALFSDLDLLTATPVGSP